MTDALSKMTLVGISMPSLGPLVAASVFSALLLRVIYNLYFHPLSRFQGPWYAASFSISHAVVSVLKKEPQWMLSLAKHYGSEFPSPILKSPEQIR